MALGSALLAGGSGGFIPIDVLFFQILVLLPVKCLCASNPTDYTRCHLQHSRTRPRKYVEVENRNKLALQGVSFYWFKPGQSSVAELILNK
ncbi:hypothetical protein EJB05_57046, partial [Eragrostis curvula]